MGNPEVPNQDEQPKMKPEFVGPMHGMKKEIFELDFPSAEPDDLKTKRTEDALAMEEAAVRARRMKPKHPGTPASKSDSSDHFYQKEFGPDNPEGKKS